MYKLIIAIFLSLNLNFFSHVFSQELFVVHPHKYYLNRNTTEENEIFSESIKRVNDFFCSNQMDIYWVFDNKGNTFNRKFPIKRCGAKKLRSKWGDIKSNSFNLQNTVVITGLYFNQCVSRTYKSILKKFMNTNTKEINIHFPMTAIILSGASGTVKKYEV